MSESTTIAILGAGGDCGHALTRAAAARGHRVLAVTRSGAHPHLRFFARDELVEERAADLADGAATQAAVRGADVVVMTANIPYQHWAEQLEQLVDNAVTSAIEIGARFVMVDNLYMYVPAMGSISETSPEHAQDSKGVLRARLAESVLARHRAGEVGAVIARPTDFYGPGATSSSLYMLAIEPGLRGRTMRAFLDLDQPHSYAYLPDVAEQLLEIIENPSGDGQAWVLPPTVTETQRHMIQRINAHLPKRVRVGVIPAWLFRLAGVFSPMLRAAYSVKPQFDRPWRVDGSAAALHYGFAPTTDASLAIESTVDSFR